MAYQKFEFVGGAIPEQTVETTERVGSEEFVHVDAQDNLQSAMPAETALRKPAAKGKWVLLDRHEQVIDVDTSASALLDRYTDAEPPRIAFTEIAGELKA